MLDGSCKVGSGEAATGDAPEVEFFRDRLAELTKGLSDTIISLSLETERFRLPPSIPSFANGIEEGVLEWSLVVDFTLCRV